MITEAQGLGIVPIPQSKRMVVSQQPARPQPRKRFFIPASKGESRSMFQRPQVNEERNVWRGSSFNNFKAFEPSYSDLFRPMGIFQPMNIYRFRIY